MRGIGWDVDWEGVAAKDTLKGQKMWDVCREFDWDRRLRRMPLMMGKSLKFLQTGQAGEMNGKVAKNDFLRSGMMRKMVIFQQTK